jgi:tetraacyldisaccharide 4'-kinase
MPWSDRLQEAWLSRGALAWSLAPIAVLYGLAVRIRRALYRWQFLETQRLPVPVIVVGNCVAGGAGKTPTVLALCAWMKAQGVPPGILSRGHGRRGSAVLEVFATTAVEDCGDEPLLLHLRSRCPIFVGRDRFAAGRALLQAHPEVQILICDDGMQHAKLARDLQIVVFDERGAGNGFLLPAGPLREPMASTPPPNSLVLYNAPSRTTAWPGTIVRRQLSGLVRLQDWWAGGAPSLSALHALAGQQVIAAAGVARPERFFSMLQSAGLKVQRMPLPDHHGYAEIPWPASSETVIVTEKDAVKLNPLRDGLSQVLVAALDFQLDAAFEVALQERLATLLPNTLFTNPLPRR